MIYEQCDELNKSQSLRRTYSPLILQELKEDVIVRLEGHAAVLEDLRYNLSIPKATIKIS